MSSPNTSGSSSLPRLGPTWYKGAGNQGSRGFQPPPAVPAERLQRARSGSAGSSGSETKPNVNKFSVLDDDDDVAGNGEKRLPENSRSEALRSFHRSSSGGTRPPGRSLADLAARTSARSGSFREEGRFSKGSGDGDSAKKVIRFTRERLLSMRVPPKPDAPNPPPQLKQLEGTAILSDEPQDPVCWDPFDPDEIWAHVARERMPRSSSIGEPKGSIRGLAEEKRRSSTGPAGGRWERGVALPPPDESEKRTRVSRGDADNPNDLWDDPVGGTTGAAADFSSFGTIPDDPKSGGDAFDFNEMAEASRRFELERRGSKGSDGLSDGEDADHNIHSVQVDPHRPLASAGTTIRSGSGDDVNVFEDFETPAESDAPADSPAIKSGNVDADASSRLMKMIGVNDNAAKDEEKEKEKEEEEEKPSEKKQIDPWGMEEKNVSDQEPKSAAILSNPWGSAVGADTSQQPSGLDLGARLAEEQKAREAQIAAELERRNKVQEAEMLRRRQQEEEEAKQRALRAQQEQEAKQRALRAQQEQAEAAKTQQQQGAAGPSQVELVLMERISNFLENSWGRSDLMSILSTLHAEDSRVIPLLGSVDALRALIARHPNRIGLRQDPAFGAEMAVILLTNSQWKQQQQEQQQRAREVELQRAEEQRRLQAMQQAAAQEKPRIPPIVHDAPWFYSDPQNNIQGPFRGEEMRQWLEAGYFKGDLPISQQPTGPFVPLKALFPDLLVAFKHPDQSELDAKAEAAAAAAAAAAAEEEKRVREAEEAKLAAEERIKAEAKAAAEAAERERREKEASEKKQLKDENQSAQLKMMLGVGKPSGSEEEAVPRKNGRTAQTETVQLKSTPKLQRQQAATAPVPSRAPAPSQQAPAWGGAATAAPRKSISEIQQEEARAAAKLAMERQHITRSSSGGWANVAASKGGSTGWGSGTVKTTPAAVVTSATANARVPQGRPTHPVATSQRQPSAAATQRSRTEKPVDDFGATMPPSLEKWCKDQMKKLNGSDDLTLVSFCMTLNDSDEIRQYLTAYLGSTPQVNNFATEFINRKNGSKGTEEWATPVVKGKKGKKKK